MAILAFQRPDEVIMLESTDFIGKFEFRPLEPGYGITIGNALRRILLSSLEGFAITSVKIEGVDHEFSSIRGVMEDVTEIILNLKKIRFKHIVEDQFEQTINVNLIGKEKFTSGDLNKYLTNFSVINTDVVICHMTKDVKLQMFITINKGRGYVPAEENQLQSNEIGVIAIDSIYTPIVNVKIEVENYRVEQKTDYDKLIIEIQTDGSIHPKDALKEAAKILIQHFMLFSDEKISLEAPEVPEIEDFDEDNTHIRQILKTRLIDMDLSVRALNCLKTAEVETLGELVQFHRNDLLKFRNFGKKSLNELDEFLATLKLAFGMDVTRYKLDKD